jgi:phosphoserine phosphatase
MENASLVKFLKIVESRAQVFDEKKHEMYEKNYFFESLIENAMKLKGISIADFEKLSEILELTPGTIELIRILKSMGFKIALISSGFGFFIKKIFEKAGVDYAFSNVLKCDENGMITGEMEEPIITKDTKSELLDFIMKLENVGPDQVVAVSDGSTRSNFIKNAGLSIAFKPYEEVSNADGILSGDNIKNMLFCLGISRGELRKYLKNT